MEMENACIQLMISKHWNAIKVGFQIVKKFDDRKKELLTMDMFETFLMTVEII